MTYKEIQTIFRKRNNKSISTCAIAGAKRKLGLTVKISPNRIDRNQIQKKPTEYEIGEIKEILGLK
jgi:hypothetical protein